MKELNKSQDSQFKEYMITKVIKDTDGWILCSVSIEFVCPYTDIKPIKGMTARVYGEEGHTIRGIDINEVEVFYRTPADDEKRHLLYVKNYNRKQQSTFKKNKKNLDARYNALPEIYRRRIDKFRANNIDFRWKYESYEMLCCEQSIIIASNVPIDRMFAISAYSEKDLDIHSANTFYFSVMLAYLSKTDPEGVVKACGALAALVGSEEYGCIPRGKPLISSLTRGGDCP